MKLHNWIAMGIPALTLSGWGNDSQAAGPLIEYETTAKVPRITLSLSPSSPLLKPATSTTHLLSFAPPKMDSKNLELQADGSSPVDSQPLAETSGSPLLPVPDVPVPQAQSTTATKLHAPLPAEVATLFDGDADSLVALAVGSAEGTRTPTGERTLAYYGHVDPGNQVWNQGTFSYQHGAKSPEDADQKQISRLKKQATVLYHLAASKGLKLTLEEALNGIDLANQAPTAALDRGYIDWLLAAQKMGLQDREAILWARTRSFLDPDTGRWNAPGLGNSVQSITQDQARRQYAIAQAIAVNSNGDQGNFGGDQEKLNPDKTANLYPLKAPAPKAEKIDHILSMDLPEP